MMMIKNFEGGSAKVLIIILLLVVLAGTGYFMFSGTKESPRPKRISKRVKIFLTPQIKANVMSKKGTLKDNERSVQNEGNVNKQIKATVLSPHHTSIEKPKGILPPDKLYQRTATKRKPVAKATKKTSKILAAKKKNEAKLNKSWAINVISTGSEYEAGELAKKMKSAGYNAYVTRFQSKEGSIWFRLRVGFFPSRSEAKLAASKISKKFGIKDSWVVKPGSNEVKKFIR